MPWGAVESCCHGPAVLSFLTDESPGDKHEKCLQNDNNQDTAYNYLGQFYKKNLFMHQPSLLVKFETNCLHTFPSPENKRGGGVCIQD